MEPLFPQIELIQQVWNDYQIFRNAFRRVCAPLLWHQVCCWPSVMGWKHSREWCCARRRKKNEITCFGSKQAFHPFISNSTRCMMMKWHAQRYQDTINFLSLVITKYKRERNEEERFLPWVSEATETPTRNKAKAATSTRQRAMKKEKERISLSWKIVLVRFELGGWACLN